MCGIAGVWNLDVSLDEILKEQAHRGPDVSGALSIPVFDGSEFHLGHNRLKIICLSDAANQPLVDRDGQYVLSFNGEIYNYIELRAILQAEGRQFSTSSDSEVLLQALIHWGIEALAHINGMFAFAFFCKKTQCLYLARDRFGVKPLYYYVKDKAIAFASSSRSMARQLGLKTDVAYLSKGLNYGIFEDGSSTTPYQSLKLMQAGHFLKFDFSTGSIPVEQVYYPFKERVLMCAQTIQQQTPNQLKEMVLAQLAEACTIRLRSDVPVAIALSGGLDSSTLAAIAHQQQGSLKAFCFGDPKDKHSEAGLVRSFTKHHAIETDYIVPSMTDWSEAFGAIHRYQEAPVAGISVLAQYLLYKGIKSQGYKVVLGGQGGDEAFLGYRKFQLFHLKTLLKQKNWLALLRYFYFFSHMMFAERKKLLMYWQLRSKFNNGNSVKSTLSIAEQGACLNLGRADSMLQRQLADISAFSLPTLLRYEDRNSMAHGIESRLPFMDYQMIELACALPLAMKIHKGFGKWVIREVMKGQIPDNIRLARYKRGFDVSQSKAVYDGLQTQIQSALKADYQFYQSCFVKPSVPLLDYFSTNNLQHQPKRFTELSVLLWLGALGQ